MQNYACYRYHIAYLAAQYHIKCLCAYVVLEKTWCGQINKENNNRNN